MRAIVVMFDSLNRRHLPPYDPGAARRLPSFARLAEQAVTFENCYAGSMPCMPARRELHTGRHNFLHRSWGPLEPFDDSVPRMLSDAGVCTHLATDHPHYWQDGGATYHTRYRTFSLIRGQEGDPWKGRVRPPAAPSGSRVVRSGLWWQDRVNRDHLRGVADHPQTGTFDAGLEFVRENRDEQDWFVQIETFDPHEPFFSPPAARSLGDHDGAADGADTGDDWPDTKQVTERHDVVDRIRHHYATLVSMCDASLGRVLDAMDDHRLWGDTMLIVCTDHGIMLGERDWWGKGVPPWFDEVIHTPLFVWDPHTGVSGRRRSALVQTIDIGPTLLDWFGVPPTRHMQGRALRPVLEDDSAVRRYGLFGAFGGHVSVTDGRYVYMRAPADPANRPLFEHTVMPTRLRGFFAAQDLREAEWHPGFDFTDGVPVLRMPGRTFTDPYAFGTLLFDLEADPDQRRPFVDVELETRMATALTELMRRAEAPPSQYERLGLPESGPIEPRHLLCAAQEAQARYACRPVPPIDGFPVAPVSVRSTVAEIFADPDSAEVMARHAPWLAEGPPAAVGDDVPLYHAAHHLLGLFPWDRLRAVAEDLARLHGRADG